MSSKRAWRRRLLQIVGGLFVGLLLAEIVLWISGIPRFYKPRSTPGQFMIVPGLAEDGVGYLNARSHNIRFEYDGDPRDYFSDGKYIDHPTNMAGFRGLPVEAERDDQGRIIIRKPPNSKRLVFLGDSFTFGEGVWFEDTYAEQTVKFLQAENLSERYNNLHALNLGVAGYNTPQELNLLRKVGLPAQPDIVILGFVLNDAEPPLFQTDPRTGQPFRVRREIEEMTSIEQPEGLIYKSRIVRLIAQMRQGRAMHRRTIEYYRSLYDETNPHWVACQSSLASLVSACRGNNIPCVVVIFPLLIQLNEDYPFSDIHKEIKSIVENAGGTCVDLLPSLRGRTATSLWVHPTDHHPNEIVHRLAGEQIAKEIVARGWLK